MKNVGNVGGAILAQDVDASMSEVPSLCCFLGCSKDVCAKQNARWTKSFVPIGRFKGDMKQYALKSNAEPVDGHYQACCTHAMTKNNKCGFGKEVNKLKQSWLRESIKKSAATTTTAPAPSPVKRPSPVPQLNTTRKVSYDVLFLP